MRPLRFILSTGIFSALFSALLSAVLSIVLFAALLTPTVMAKVVGTLDNVETNTSILIDGVVDTAWSAAPVLKVYINKIPYQPNNGYEGIKQTTYTIQSMRKQGDIYFLIQWADPTESVNRFPWMQQADGRWQQLMNKDDTGHDNTYYEDKMAVLWNINLKTFNKKGCAAACHMAKDGMQKGIADKAPGRKYTKAGTTIDMWHWKGVRSNPVGQADDQYIHDNTEPKANKNWGRSGDAKTGGGYSNNVQGGQPAFVQSDLTNESVVVLDAKKMPLDASWLQTNRIPGIVTAPFTGSRGDLTAKGVWNDGIWTLEIRRAMVTTGDKSSIQDVQFIDLSKAYDFGVSVFDNSQINHVYHDGVLQLRFK